MPKGVITRVWPKKGRGPGSVVFSDGGKHATFSDATLELASELVGQLVEYTLEQSTSQAGVQYTNLGRLTPLGKPQFAGSGNGSGNVETGGNAQSRGPAAVIDLEMRKTAARIATALEELVAEVRRQNNAFTTVSGGTDTVAVTVGASVDPIEAMQSLLANEVGDASAEAMFSALRKKHKTPEKLQEAAAALLGDHGIAYGGGAA